MTRRALLKSWAIAALTVFILSIILPAGLGRIIFTTDPAASQLHRAATVLLAALVFVIVVGFQIVMLLECSRAKNVRNQPMWLIFLACVPFIPAFLYYWRVYSRTSST